MVRKVGITDMEDLEPKTEAFIGGADMTVNPAIPETTAKKRGRKKSNGDAQSVMKAVYFDEKTADTVDNYCSEFGVAFSVLVKMLLKKEGVL